MFGNLKRKVFRQGDVMLEFVADNKTFDDALKASTNPLRDATIDENRIVLAYGEVTGHAHAIYPEVEVIDGEEKTVLPAKLWDAGAERFLQVIKKTALKHEEHAPIPLDPGVYRVIQQREYDPEEAARQRRVAD